MKRGDLYLLRHPGDLDRKKQRMMTVVSGQTLVDSRFPTVVCASVFTRGHGLETEVSVEPEDEHPSWIGCEGLVSIPKNRLTNSVGSLSPEKLWRLSQATKIALGIKAGWSELSHLRGSAILLLPRPAGLFLDRRIRLFTRSGRLRRQEPTRLRTK